jgi:hypothetical protein
MSPMGPIELIGAVGTVVGTATAIGEIYRRRGQRAVFAIVCESAAGKSVRIGLRNDGAHVVYDCTAVAAWSLMRGGELRGFTECKGLGPREVFPVFVPASVRNESMPRTYLELADEFDRLTIQLAFARKIDGSCRSTFSLTCGMTEVATLSSRHDGGDR